MKSMTGDLGAFRLRLDLRDETAVDGPLTDLTFAVKDMFDAPEVSMPLAKSEGCPIGLSLMGPKNGDCMLLHAVTEITRLTLADAVAWSIWNP